MNVHNVKFVYTVAYLFKKIQSCQVFGINKVFLLKINTN